MNTNPLTARLRSPRAGRPRLRWHAFAPLALLALACGCRNISNRPATDAELERLRRENLELRATLDDLLAKPSEERTPISFTVGLAASEKTFDEGAFLEFLKKSLEESSAQGQSFTIEPETREEEIAKVRGMLVQQHLSSQRVPIRISNLTYSQSAPEASFSIGSARVPASQVEAAGGSRHTFEGPLLAHMERETADTYAIPYEDSAGGGGSIQLNLRDLELFLADAEPQLARQGDISFNWQLSLEKFRVYRVSEFSGDGGRFLLRMRYPRGDSGLDQYQTMNDVVFLLGYGPYRTGLVQRMVTPAYIDRVEVLALEPRQFDALQSGATEGELQSTLGSSQAGWVECAYVEQEGEEKSWERPFTIQFPFLSRQTSSEKGLVFYHKYGQGDPPSLISYHRMNR